MKRSAQLTARLASVGLRDNTVIVWNVASGEQVNRFTSESRIRLVAYSPDGSQLMAGDLDNPVITWDVGSGSQVNRPRGGDSWTRSVAYCPHGSTRAVSACDPRVSAYDESNKRLYEHDLDDVVCVANSPDGLGFALGCCDGKIILWTIPPSYKKIVNSVDRIPQVLYICSRLAQLQDSTLTDTSSEDEDLEKDEQTESFYTSLVSRISALAVSSLASLGKAQFGEGFVDVCNEEQLARCPLRQLRQLYDSLPGEIRELLDTKH